MTGRVRIMYGHREYNGKTGIAEPCPNWQEQYDHSVLLDEGTKPLPSGSRTILVWEKELKQEYVI